MNRQFALACPPTLALHLAAGLSALSAPSAHWTRLAHSKSAQILAPTPAALELSAQSKTTIQFALVLLVTLVIHSPDAALNVSYSNWHMENEEIKIVLFCSGYSRTREVNGKTAIMCAITLRTIFSVPDCRKQPCLLLLARLHRSSAQLQTRVRFECRMS
jgi:hypothetical protein